MRTLLQNKLISHCDISLFSCWGIPSPNPIDHKINFVATHPTGALEKAWGFSLILILKASGNVLLQEIAMGDYWRFKAISFALHYTEFEVK